MRRIIIVFTFLVPFHVEANSGLYVVAGLGKGEIDVVPEFQVNNVKEANKTFDYQVLLGYRFANKLQIEAGHMSHGSLDLFGLSDNSSMAENVILLGYGINLTQRIKVTPRVGYSFWEFESTEGWVLNAGPEKQFRNEDQEFIYTLSASYRSLYLTYQSVDYDFGSVNSLMFGLELEL